MKFEDFIKNGQARKASIDTFLINSIHKTALSDLKYLNTQQITSISCRKIISNYYDCLRAILEAVALKEGYKIYQHEALTFFLKEKNEETQSIKFDRFRKIRNKINYYGEDLSVQEAKEIS